MTEANDEASMCLQLECKGEFCKEPCGKLNKFIKIFMNKIKSKLQLTKTNKKYKKKLQATHIVVRKTRFKIF